MEPDDGQLRTGYFPDRRYAAGESLWFVHHHVRQAVVTFEAEDLLPVFFVKPRPVPELDGQLVAGKEFRTALDVVKVRRSIHEPWRKLEQHCVELARLLQGHNRCAEALPQLREELVWHVCVVDVRFLDGPQRVADVLRQSLWRRLMLGEQAKGLDIEYEHLRGALGPER